MKEIHTKIEIHAPADHVWQILMDFRMFAEWNPFIPSIKGEMKKGERIEVFLKPPGKKKMKFRPKVLNVEPGKEFRWFGHLGIPGIFDGEHIFSIEPLGEESVRFVQKEKFTGIFASLILRSIESATRQGFPKMNEALKVRSEKK